MDNVKTNDDWASWVLSLTTHVISISYFFSVEKVIIKYNHG